MQKIVHYNQDLCFSRTTGFPEQFFKPQYYVSAVAFEMDPQEEIIVVLQQCGDSWFRQGVAHELGLIDGKFSLVNRGPFQLCLSLRNFSDYATILVGVGTPLTRLLAQNEILYQLTVIPVQTLWRVHQANSFLKTEKVPVTASTDNNTIDEAEEGEIQDSDDDDNLMYYVRIV